MLYHILFKNLFIDLRERKEGSRERERERHRFDATLIYAFIGRLMYVPRLGIEPTTLACQDDAPAD